MDAYEVSTLVNAARNAPTLFRDHEPDEGTELGVAPGPSWLARDAAPTGAIRLSVPGDHGGGSDDRQGLDPVGPQRAQSDPEKAVGRYESWTAATVSEGGKLMSQGEIVEDECLSRACQGANGPDDEFEEKQHCRTMRADPWNSKGKGERPSRRGRDNTHTVHAASGRRCTASGHHSLGVSLFISGMACRHFRTGKREVQHVVC